MMHKQTRRRVVAKFQRSNMTCFARFELHGPEQTLDLTIAGAPNREVGKWLEGHRSQIHAHMLEVAQNATQAVTTTELNFRHWDLQGRDSRTGVVV